MMLKHRFLLTSGFVILPLPCYSATQALNHRHDPPRNTITQSKRAMHCITAPTLR
jgi:hypothetical protein